MPLMLCAQYIKLKLLIKNPKYERKLFDENALNNSLYEWTAHH